MDKLISDVVAELEAARAGHPAFHSYHEGYAVLLEESDELWEEIKKRHPDRARVRAEAIQVCAMALRLIVDCCGDV